MAENAFNQPKLQSIIKGRHTVRQKKLSTNTALGDPLNRCKRVKFIDAPIHFGWYGLLPTKNLSGTVG